MTQNRCMQVEDAHISLLAVPGRLAFGTRLMSSRRNHRLKRVGNPFFQLFGDERDQAGRVDVDVGGLDVYSNS
jgi:hypothetical protein